jgi:hypothetical protein
MQELNSKLFQMGDGFYEFFGTLINPASSAAP